MLKDVDENGRLHRDFNPTGARTGRPSSRGLQNVPREKSVKGLFIARPGYKLVQADLSQAEVRCFAHYSNEDVLRNAFATEGIDVHSMVAAEIANIPYEKFMERIAGGDESSKELRQKAKATVFGLLYGRGVASIANEYKMKLEEAQEFMNQFFNRFSNCEKWIKHTHKLVRETGEVQNIFGRVRRLPGIFSDDKGISSRAERQSVNSIIQSTASDITLLSLCSIHNYLKQTGWDSKIVLTVYDSIITETKDEYVEQTSNLMVDVMESKPAKDFTVKMKADVDIYPHSWGVK
jgi:DNA polymerase-1